MKSKRTMIDHVKNRVQVNTEQVWNEINKKQG